MILRFKYFLILYFILSQFSAKAMCDPETLTDCPIDGGASLLVGAGVVYGMKRIRDKKKSKKDLKDTI